MLYVLDISGVLCDPGSPVLVRSDSLGTLIGKGVMAMAPLAAAAFRAFMEGVLLALSVYETVKHRDSNDGD